MSGNSSEGNRRLIAFTSICLRFWRSNRKLYVSNPHVVHFSFLLTSCGTKQKRNTVSVKCDMNLMPEMPLEQIGGSGTNYAVTNWVSTDSDANEFFTIADKVTPRSYRINARKCNTKD